jgi:hypothetical protein
LENLEALKALLKIQDIKIPKIIGPKNQKEV